MKELFTLILFLASTQIYGQAGTDYHIPEDLLTPMVQETPPEWLKWTLVSSGGTVILLGTILSYQQISQSMIQMQQKDSPVAITGHLMTGLFCLVGVGFGGSLISLAFSSPTPPEKISQELLNN